VCDLSYLTHLEVTIDVDHNELAGELELSIMEAYNIGGNLEILAIPEHNREVFLRTPKLKVLRTECLLEVPPDICPMLQTVECVEDFNYEPKYADDWKKAKLDLESRSIEVRLFEKRNNSVLDEMTQCFACGENHT
jgi:hypothetical protein